jgi:hypothetical protein
MRRSGAARDEGRDMSTMQQAGWHPDPWGQAAQRWWDGAQWTPHVAGAPARRHQTFPAPPSTPAGRGEETTSRDSGWAVPGATTDTADPDAGAATAPPAPGAWPPATGAYATGPGQAQGTTTWSPTPGAGTAGQPVPGTAPGPWAGHHAAYHAPWAGQPATPRPPPLVRTNPLAAVVLAAGVALVAVGSFLPWAKVDSRFGDYTVSGMDGDGPLTLIGAIGVAVLGGLAVLGPWAKGALTGLAVSALVVAGLVTLVALVDIADVASRFGEADAIGLDMSVGVGLWVVLVGGLAASAGAVIALVASVRRPTPVPALPYGVAPGWQAGYGAAQGWPR